MSAHQLRESGQWGCSAVYSAVSNTGGCCSDIVGGAWRVCANSHSHAGYVRGFRSLSVGDAIGVKALKRDDQLCPTGCLVEDVACGA